MTPPKTLDEKIRAALDALDAVEAHLVQTTRPLTSGPPTAEGIRLVSPYLFALARARVALADARADDRLAAGET